MTRMSNDQKSQGGESSTGSNAEPKETATYHAELTLDELRAVVECAPDLLLPPMLDLGRFEESAFDGGPSVEVRRVTALDALIAKGVVSDVAESLQEENAATGGSPWVLHSLLRAALTVPLVAESVIRVKSWTPRTSSRTMVAVAKSVASTFTVTVDRQRGEESTDPTSQLVGNVSISVGPFSSISESLTALLDAAPPEPDAVRPISLRVGLVTARSLIEAIKQGDETVVYQLAEQLGASEGLSVLRSLAATMEAGFRMQVTVRPDRLILTSDWVQSNANEWVTMRLVVPGHAGKVTAEVLTDEGQVDIIRSSRSMITTEIVSAVSIVAEHAVNVAAAKKGDPRGV